MRPNPVSNSVWICCGLLLALSPRAHTALLPGYGAGSGANTSYLLIDFEYIGGDAYYFTYKYDGQATAGQMLLALDAAGDLAVHRQYFDLGSGPTLFVDGFTYDGNSSIPFTEGSQGEYWSYWLVDHRIAAPSFWSFSGTGPDGRVLEDGSLDGWSLNVAIVNQGGFEPTFDPPLLPILGDVDGDADIDDSDLGAAFANYTGPVGGSANKSRFQGDTDRDGDVDDSDLGTLFSIYTGPLSLNRVPEPTSATLLCLAASPLLRQRY